MRFVLGSRLHIYDSNSRQAESLRFTQESAAHGRFQTDKFLARRMRIVTASE